MTTPADPLFLSSPPPVAVKPVDRPDLVYVQRLRRLMAEGAPVTLPVPREVPDAVVRGLAGTPAPRWRLLPGLVFSRNDGDRHYIDAARLAQLYGVSLGECLVGEPRRDDPRGLPELFPRRDGNYQLPEVCACEFDPYDLVPGQAPEESYHYRRECRHCGRVWWGLHCRHDGHQNPCPGCLIHPQPVPELPPPANT